MHVAAHRRKWDVHTHMRAHTHTHVRAHTQWVGVSVVKGCRSMETTDWLVCAAEKQIALGPKLLYSTTLASNTHTHTRVHMHTHSYRPAAEHLHMDTQAQQSQT